MNFLYIILITFHLCATFNSRLRSQFLLEMTGDEFYFKSENCTSTYTCLKLQNCNQLLFFSYGAFSRLQSILKKLFCNDLTFMLKLLKSSCILMHSLD